MRRFYHVVSTVVAASRLRPQQLNAAGRFNSGKASLSGVGSADEVPPSYTASVGNVLPGVDLAKRVTSPDELFPATWSSNEPLAPDDPRVVWKEHYSLAEERPYYHNINTNETVSEVPEGFVTRFPQFYRKSGCFVDESGAVHMRREEHGAGRCSSDITGDEPKSSPSSPESREVKRLSTKQKLAAYGGGGILWYLIVHNVSLAIVFSLLYFFKVDLVGVARSYGFNVKVRPGEEVNITDVDRRQPFFKTLFLAIILNKLMVPVQLVCTLATAPLFVHRLEPIAVVLIPKTKALFSFLMSKVTGALP